MQHRFSRVSPFVCTAMAAVVLSLGATAPVAAQELSAKRQRVRIEFVPTVGDTPVSCNTVMKGLGTTGTKARLQDLRFYVANVQLAKTVNGKEVIVPVKLDANNFQLTSGSDTVALIDLENGNVATSKGACVGDTVRHVAITGSVPLGTYTKILFTLGVPESLNHTATSTAPAPLDNTDMAWSWQSGRKHIKIEVNPYNATTQDFTQAIAKFDSSGNPTGAYNTSFYFHLGNTGCMVDATAASGYSCSSNNTLPLHIHGFDYNTQRIAVDLKALFAQSNLMEEHGSAPGCMSGPTDPECVAMWSAIGSSFVTQTTSTGSTVTISTHDLEDDFFHGHTVFRAISK